jgi:hypothetical protein
VNVLVTTYSAEKRQVEVFLEPPGATECGELLAQLKN